MMSVLKKTFYLTSRRFSKNHRDLNHPSLGSCNFFPAPLGDSFGEDFGTFFGGGHVWQAIRKVAQCHSLRPGILNAIHKCSE